MTCNLWERETTLISRILDKREYVAINIIGPNGSGKTSLAHDVIEKQTIATGRAGVSIDCDSLPNGYENIYHFILKRLEGPPFLCVLDNFSGSSISTKRNLLDILVSLGGVGTKPLPRFTTSHDTESRELIVNKDKKTSSKLSYKHFIILSTERNTEKHFPVHYELTLASISRDQRECLFGSMFSKIPHKSCAKFIAVSYTSDLILSEVISVFRKAAMYYIKKRVRKSDSCVGVPRELTGNDQVHEVMYLPPSEPALKSPTSLISSSCDDPITCTDIKRSFEEREVHTSQHDCTGIPNVIFAPSVFCECEGCSPGKLEGNDRPGEMKITEDINSAVRSQSSRDSKTHNLDLMDQLNQPNHFSSFYGSPDLIEMLASSLSPFRANVEYNSYQLTRAADYTRTTKDHGRINSLKVIVIAGTPGSGKSHLVSCIKEYIDARSSSRIQPSDVFASLMGSSEMNLFKIIEQHVQCDYVWLEPRNRSRVPKNKPQPFVICIDNADIIFPYEEYHIQTAATPDVPVTNVCPGNINEGDLDRIEKEYEKQRRGIGVPTDQGMSVVSKFGTSLGKRLLSVVTSTLLDNPCANGVLVLTCCPSQVILEELRCFSGKGNDTPFNEEVTERIASLLGINTRILSKNDVEKTQIFVTSEFLSYRDSYRMFRDIMTRVDGFDNLVLSSLWRMNGSTVRNLAKETLCACIRRSLRERLIDTKCTQEDLLTAYRVCGIGTKSMDVINVY